MAITEEERERMLDGLLGLRRVRALLPSNDDVELGIEGIETALGETVPQRTAARALGITHPEVSKLISSQKLLTIDNVRGKAQVSVRSLVELIEDGGGSADGPKRKQKFKGEDGGGGKSPVPTGGGDIQQIMELRALAFHRALARNLDRATVDRAREVVGEWRSSGQMTDEQADEWDRILDRPVSDVASKMTDYSPAGHELRKNSPFNSMGRRAEDRELPRT